MMQEKCRKQPEALAINSWDGDLTYNEPEDHAWRLASQLQTLGVGPNTFVAVYLEKSLWTVVAHLAVLMAGAAFATLETSQPMNRLREICRTVQPTVELTSDELWVSGADLESSENHIVKASDAMYSIATSDTTRKPKVGVIEHQAFLANLRPLIDRWGFTVDSRVLQFAGYSFDAMVVEHFITLPAGGCICIPSSFNRDNRLAMSMNEMRINWAMLTASATQLLNPAAVLTLQTLVQAGEPMHQGIIDRWASHVRLFNGYGPRECSVISSTSNLINPDARNPKNIGFATGGVCWIVDPEHAESPPVPIGAEGELIIEGPILARGYLGDPVRTAAAFTPRPRWLDDFRGSSGENRISRTGDIVRYDPDGSVSYVRRKDFQVKLRGQRVELLEVEHHFQNRFPDALQIVADIITLPDTRVAPSTDLERELQAIWPRILNITPDTIGIHDSFFRLGGDSITRYYEEAIQWKVVSRVPIDVHRLRDAWRQVVDRHAVLRTVFLDVCEENYLDQVVLRSHSPTVLVYNDGEDPGKPVSAGYPQPMHHLQVKRSSAGEITVRLHINHALVDGHSLFIIRRDLAMAYEGRLASSHAPSLYRDYIAYLQNRHSQNQSGEYWKSYVEGTVPCLFPESQIGIHQPAPRGVGYSGPTLHGNGQVCFGYMTSGRHVSLAGAQDIVGPLFNILVARVGLPYDAPVLSVMQKYQDGFLTSLDHQHQSLAETLHSIKLASGELFNSLVSIFNDTREGDPAQKPSAVTLVGDDVHSRSEYPITLNLLMLADQIHMQLSYHTSLLSDNYASVVAKTFRHVLITVLRQPQLRLNEVEVLDEEHRSNRYERNNTMVASPDSFCAWDGDISYRQLDQLSSSLAEELIGQGIGVEMTIPVLLEMPCWTPVAMVAVLKSGASFIPTDASHPLGRLQTIYEATNAPMILASPQTRYKAVGLSPNVIEITNRLFEREQAEQRSLWQTVAVEGSDTAYMSRPYINSASRVLQFSSHAWDIPVTDVLLTLRAGGCVCIPSDEESTCNIGQAANRMMANWAFSTPTVARLVKPEDFTHLETLVLGGEAMSLTDLTTWHDKVRLIQGYGPAECRELVLEGPIVSRGYINDPERSAAAFVDPPSWLARLREGHMPNRLYETGDLVKIRGQRVELGEVEAMVSQTFPGSHVVVELVKDLGSALLVALILQKQTAYATPSSSSSLLHPPSDLFRESISAAVSSLRETMPSYIIPTVFLPLAHLPRTPTDKADRKLRRDHIASLSRMELEAYSTVDTTRRAPSTPLEARLQEHVGYVLHRSSHSIPLDENLFKVGLGSLTAMALATSAREGGLHAILRTAFVPFQETFVQVSLHDFDLPVQEIWTDEDDPSVVTESICREADRIPVSFGTPSTQLLLILGRESGRLSAVLRLHRAQYDGVAVSCIIADLRSAFEEATSSPPPTLEYADFIISRAARNSSAVFQVWQELLQGSSMTYLVPPNEYIRSTDRSHTELLVMSSCDIPMPDTKGGATMATVIKAAWALYLARQTQLKTWSSLNW
ncbi:hypothetical protein DL769_011228 [Monosporascus sp. CRB-8-3]|nr:hypothetical protein DL769_011228 [Monosporascus sp. CRB-8-3]